MEFILNKVKKSYEVYYKLKINKNIVNYIISNTDKYMPNLYNPDKSIEVLDTVCSKKILDNYVNKSKDMNIKMIDVDNLIKERVNIINIDDNKFNKYMFLNGESKSKEKIISYIANRLGINLININCLEFNDEFGVNKLINNNYLYNKIDENPYSIICFNNYDKAGRIIRNLVDSMISNGYISNMNNEKVYLNNSIIFVFNNEETSRIGFNELVA